MMFARRNRRFNPPGSKPARMFSFDRIAPIAVLAALFFVAAYGAASARRMHNAAVSKELAAAHHSHSTPSPARSGVAP